MQSFFIYTLACHVHLQDPGLPGTQKLYRIVSGFSSGKRNDFGARKIPGWKKNNRSWRTGINHDKSWFKVSTCAASMAIQGPESQTSEPGIKAACHGRQLSSGSMVISWSTFSQENPEIARDCMLFVDHENPQTNQYECYQGTSTMYITQPLLSSGVWVIGTKKCPHCDLP